MKNLWKNGERKYPDVELSQLLKNRDSEWAKKAKGQLEG